MISASAIMYAESKGVHYASTILRGILGLRRLAPFDSNRGCRAMQWSKVMSKKEEWRPIARMSGYDVSNYGNIRSWNKPGGIGGSTPRHIPKTLKQPKSNYKEYWSIYMRRNGKITNIKAHRAVLEAFVGTCPPGMESSHLDGNKLNNRLCNLVWETPIQNQCRKKAHGTWLRGELCNQSILSEKQVISIRRMLAETNISQSKIADIFNITIYHVNDIKTGRIWKHSKKYALKAKNRSRAASQNPRVGSIKLTKTQVMHIYKSKGKISNRKIANRYGIGARIVSDIRCEKLWSWLTTTHTKKLKRV